MSNALHYVRSAELKAEQDISSLMNAVETPNIDLGELDGSTFAAISNFLQDFEFTKWQVFALIVFVGLTWQMRHIFAHFQAMAKIKNDFALKQKKLDAKIEGERDKRKRKTLKGKTL